MELIQSGRCEVVVLSLGAVGAILATADGTELLGSCPGASPEPGGSAGDSMLGAVVLALPRGRRCGRPSGTASPPALPAR